MIFWKVLKSGRIYLIIMSLGAGASSERLQGRSCEFFCKYQVVKSASIFIAECMMEFSMDNLRMEFVLFKVSSRIQFEINMTLSK